MKRTLAMLLAVVMLIGMLPTLALAAGTPTITLTTDAAAAPAVGDTFSVTATLADNPGFASITLSLVWNDEAVSFTGFREIDDDGDILLDSILSGYSPVYNQEKGIVTAARATNSTKNGKLFVANFKVIGSGNFDIALMKNFPDFTYADENGTDLAATFDETAVSALCIAVPAQSVTLYKDSLSMTPGATYNLIPRVTPGNSTDRLVCTSSDENVATVDANGVVTAVDAGTATITATAGSVSASCVVTVSEKFIVQAQTDGEYTKLTGTLTGITECNGKTAEDVLLVNLTADMKNVKVEVPAMAAALAGRYNINDVRKNKVKANYSGALTFTTDDIFTAFAATPDELTNALGAQVAKLGTLSDTKLYALLDYNASGVSNRYCIVFAVDKTAPTEFSVTESLALKPGKTGTIVPTVAPFAAFGTPITWESDNTAVAAVDENGTVTAVAGGSATITATCGSLSDTCAVTVADQVMIENLPTIKDRYNWYFVREIWLGGVELKDYRWDGTTLNLFVPETTNTPAAITFNLEWQGNAYSKDADVEIVNGVGSYTLKEHDVSAPVINIAPYNPATGITLNKTELSFEGKGSETLTATVTPDHSSDLVVWSTSDDKVATVDEHGLVTAVETGTATITATAGAYKATCAVTVTVPKTTVNFTGTGAEDVVGGSGQITLSGEAFKFSLNPKTGYEYTVSVGEDVHPVAAEFPFSDMNSSAVYDECYPTAETVTINDCMMGDTATFTVADIYIPAGLSFETGYADVLKPGGGRTGGMEFENLPDGTLLYFLDDETFEYSTYIYRIRIGAAPAAKMTLTVDAKGACTIPAEYVTGDSLTVTVTKEALPVSVNFTGTGAEDVVGGTSQTAAYGEAFSFSLNEADGYGYEVTADVAAEGTAMEYPFKDYNSTAQWGTCFPTAETWTYNLIQSENWDTEDEVYKDVTFAVADVYIPANVVRFTTDGRARGIKPDGKGTSSFKNLPDGTMIYYYVILDDDPIYEYSYSTYAYRIRIGEAPMEKMTLTADADGSYTIPAANVAGSSLSVTVTKTELPQNPDVPAEGYTVTMPEEKAAAVGEDVAVMPEIASPNGKFNAYHFVLTYDTAKLAYNGFSIADAKVVDKDGTLTIAGYGEDRTENPVITFTALTADTSDVVLTAAKLDEAANAAVQNAPDALISNGTTKINAAAYTVVLPDGFTGDKTAEPGADYSFTANDPNYDYELSATVGGESAPVKQNPDGSFTVENVNGNLVVTEVSRTGKTVNVDLDGTGKEDVTAAPTAVYGTDYSFTVNEKPNYSYTVTVTVGGESYTGFTKSESTYTIPGTALTGEIAIRVTKTYTGPTDTRTVTVTGTGREDVTAAATATQGTDYSFTLNKAEGFDYTVTVTIGGTDYEPAVNENQYTIAGAALTGNVTISVTRTAIVTVAVSEYVQLDGKTMYLVVANCAALPAGETLAYGENTMFFSEKYEGYAWLVISTEGLETVKAAAESTIVQLKADAAAVDYTGDVNATGLVDINDAQLTYDIYNAGYESFTALGMARFLAADVNGDKTVNVEDAAAIVALVVGK
ncbi:MAG: Ig-like domain-containing protein [Clostridiales bacterium]|nr:Ig-like domain-containing protein [Candidatus Apopatocola equi]